MTKEFWTFLRFGFVGAGGFVVDASVLALMVRALHADPFIGRAVSASIAIVFTFLLNRHWSFAGSKRSFFSAFLGYLSAQGIGLACNLGVFAAMILVQSGPLTALAIASAVALIVNYFGARLLAFRS